VYGISDGLAVEGNTTAGYGVAGFAVYSGGIAVYGQNDSGGWAGFFNG
jgi:hypothetical protein